ncbi:MAG: glycosyltransferase [Pyrinomonadaceae bacterium]
MKILHVIPSISAQSGGPSQAIIPMCRTLRDAGVEVLIATTDADLDAAPPSSLQKVVTYKELPVIFFQRQLGNSFKYSRPFSRWLTQNVSNYDLVHIHAVFNHACIAAARACRKNAVPYFVRPLGTLDPWSMKQKPLRKKLFWLLVGKRMLCDAAGVHYTTHAEREAVEKSLALNHGHVVPLGIKVPNGDRRLEQTAFMSEFPELQEHPYVLVLSRLLPTKGFDVLLESFLDLVDRQEFKDWRLIFAGEGPKKYVATLKCKVEAHNACASVLFPGWLEGDKKQAVLTWASLLALPSYHENFGLCVMEALACGVPVLVSPQVNLSRDIGSVSAGWISEIDRNSLRSSLAEAFRSPVERSRRGRAGHNLAHRFRWDEIAKQLVASYDAILRQDKAFRCGEARNDK